MRLTPLTEADLESILPWRNAPAVRRAMVSQHEISLEEHRAWFQRLQQDASKRWYLYRDNAGRAQGVVYCTDLDPHQGTGFWGFYARPEAPSGTGLRMPVAARDLAFGELGLRKLNGEVLADNTRSVNLHKKVGFQEEGRFRQQHFDGDNRVDIIRLGLLADEWVERRPRLAERLRQLNALAEQRAAPRSILILSDAESWMTPDLEDLVMDWEAQGHRIDWRHDPAQAEAGDFCFCLSLGQLVPKAVRERFRHTLVVHESDLPRGKGWSPLTWQILEGQARIPVTLLEAAERVDSGPIYAQRWLQFQGHELIDELRAAQAAATRALCRWFVDDYPKGAEQARPQQGEESLYPRRRPDDSRLAPEQSLAAQFDLLRVVDNQRYPAFFVWRGERYTLAISEYKAKQTSAAIQRRHNQALVR